MGACLTGTQISNFASIRASVMGAIRGGFFIRFLIFEGLKGSVYSQPRRDPGVACRRAAVGLKVSRK